MDFDQDYSGQWSNHEHHRTFNKVLRSSANATRISERQFGDDVNFNLTFSAFTVSTDKIYQDSRVDEIYCSRNNDHPSRILFGKTYFAFAQVCADQGFNAYVTVIGNFGLFVQWKLHRRQVPFSFHDLRGKEGFIFKQF